MYAAGKIPGSFFKREGRAGEKGTLTARMIDRPMRPLFPKGWRRETQLVSIPMSIDHVVPYDILAMNGASAALQLSDIPFPLPVGAVRIGQDEDGGFVVNPDEEGCSESPLDLVVAGTEEAILMVEAGANEISEAEILDALDIAHGEIKKLCEAQRELPKQAGKAKVEIEVAAGRRGGRRRRSRTASAPRSTRPPRSMTSSSARTRPRPSRRRPSRPSPATPTTPEYTEHRAEAQLAFDKLEKETIRQRIAVDKKRPDGRAAEEIRDDLDRDRRRAAHARLGDLHPRPDAGASRSPPSARRVTRCGSTRSGSRRRSATSTTTTSRRSRSGRPASCAARSAATSATARSPSARSCRSCRPAEDFPYTIRVVSDILESNGSSSMASVCGSSLVADGRGRADQAPGGRYRDGPDQGGRRLHRPVRHRRRGGSPRRHGLQGRRHERGHHRPPDGHQDHGRDVRHPARRARAGQGRPHSHPRQDGRGDRRGPREELSQYAPRIAPIQIDTDKIGMVIGKGGETIRALSEEFDAQIDIDDDGTIRVYAADRRRRATP